jgi:hypothetical protein
MTNPVEGVVAPEDDLAETTEAGDDQHAVPDVSWYDSLPPEADARADESFTAPPSAGVATAALAVVAVAEAATRQAAREEPEAEAVTVIKAGTMPHPAPFEGEDFSSAAAAAPPVKTIPATDLLESIMALSEDEKLALFT